MKDRKKTACLRLALAAVLAAGLLTALRAAFAAADGLQTLRPACRRAADRRPTGKRRQGGGGARS